MVVETDNPSAGVVVPHREPAETLEALRVRILQAGRAAAGTRWLQGMVAPSLDTDVEEKERRLPVLKELPPAERGLWVKYVDASETDYLRRMRLLLPHVDKPYRERVAALRPLEADLEEGRQGRVTRILSVAMVPTLSGLGIQRERRAAREACVMAAAALLAYRGRRGPFPERLEEALPAAGPGSDPRAYRDPFSDQPVRYRREGTGFVVYSVGEDGTFTGPPAGAWSVSRETFFRYPPPPPRPLPVNPRALPTAPG